MCCSRQIVKPLKKSIGINRGKPVHKPVYYTSVSVCVYERSTKLRSCKEFVKAVETFLEDSAAGQPGKSKSQWWKT